MKLKRLALTLLAGLMLTACSGETVELLNFIDETSGVDYEGYQCYFLPRKDYAGDPDKYILTYDKNTLQGEAMLKRIDDIKKDINVELIIDVSHDEDSYQISAMSGIVKADLVSIYYMNAMQVLASGGFLYPITDFPEYIDLNETDKYGGANVLEPAMINSVPYAIQPLYWPGFQTADNMILVSNTDILSMNGITNFHEFYENETWTWDTFENELLKKFRVERSEGLLPALSVKESEFFDMMIYSNNVQFVTKNADGSNVANTLPDSFIHAYDKTLEWLATYDNIDSDNSWVNIDDFLSEDAAVTLAQGATVTQGAIAYKESSFSYNIMPFPSGPDAPYGKWANFIMSMRGIGISKASVEPTIAAHTLSLMTEPFEDFGGDAGLFEFYSDSIFISETDTKIFFDIADDVRYDYTFWDQADVGRQMAVDFGKAAQLGLSVTEAYEKHRGQLEKMVYDYILPNYDYMYENYYYQFED